MADRKIAVLQVVNGFGMGGIERQQTEIIKRLPADRFTQIIATMRLSGPFYPEVKATGVEVVEFPFNSLRNKQAVAHYFGLARLIRQRRVHLVYCYDFYTNIWGAISVTLAGRGKLITSRGDTGRMFSKAQLAVQRMAYACASAIVPNSDLVKDIIIEKEFVPTWKIRRIYNGIDAERFAPRAASPELARSLGLPPGATVIGAVGNLHPWKGQDTLLRAAARIREVRPDAWFLLIGEGIAQNDLQQLATQLGICEQTIFAGIRQDIPELLALMDVYVLPSQHESLPNAVMEAMACARPVVATAVGGVPELISDGVTGLLVPPGDPAAMANAVLRVLGAPALGAALGNAARERAVSKFSCDRLVENMAALYEDVLDGRV